MQKLLNLRSSLFGNKSVSNELIAEFLELYNSDEKGLQIVTRDLSTQAVPHLDGDWLSAISTSTADRSDEEQAKVEYANELISELQDADLVVIGAPMYNFSIPSVLNAWFDHVARAGVTFKYTENGSVGLLGNKKVVVIATMGGVHEIGKTDHLRPYLKTMLGFLGLTNVEVVTAQGLNMGSELREANILSAKSRISEIVRQLKLDREEKVLGEEAA